MSFRRIWIPAVLALSALSAAPSAGAEVAPAPWWGLSSGARPTQLRPGPCGGSSQPECGQVVLSAENLGNAATAGQVTFTDQLPSGVVPVAIEADTGGPAGPSRGPVSCTLGTLTCTFGEYENAKKEIVHQSLSPFEEIEMRIIVRVEAEAVAKAAAGELENRATVTGGGAAYLKSAGARLQVGSSDRFEIEDFTLTPEEAGGAIDTQAGSHPFQLTSALTFDSQTPDGKGRPRSAGLAKDIVTELPAGLLENPTPFAQCTSTQFAREVQLEGQTVNACPASAAVGVATLTVNEPNGLGFGTLTAPIFNLVPHEGEPARYGIKAGGAISAILDASQRSGRDYGLDLSALEVSQAQWLLAAKLTFWGVPGAAAHDGQRGWDCLEGIGGAGACTPSGALSPPPLLTMPTSCLAGSFQAAVRADSWGGAGAPAETAEPFAYRLPLSVDGCNHLPFAPEIKLTPDQNAGSTPTGMDLDVHVPQQLAQNAEGLDEAAVRDIAVTLPAGVAVDLAAADGLQACAESIFAAAPPSPLEAGASFCPDASKIGTAEIVTPLLVRGENLLGSIYLAAQNANPFGSLLAIYIAAEDPISGDLVKLAGELRQNESGQLTIALDGYPQLPFEDLDLHFAGGERAPLANPARCGAYTTSATFTPWSAEPGDEATVAIGASSTFDIASGPEHGPCPGATLPFDAAVVGGSTNINAGAFTPFTITLARSDGQQGLRGFSARLPAGLSALLGAVKPCGEAQANAGGCGPESQIGETTIAAGVGNQPVTLPGGRVYLTEDYAGAPFGLSIVTPVKAGPFDLEHDTANPAQQPGCDCVVVRAAIALDPHTAQLTITIDPSDPHALPGTVDGVPLELQSVGLTIDREHFFVNPTSCDPASVTGTVAGDEGAASQFSDPFQVANCALLTFTPTLSASTSAKTSKAGGAGLTVKLTYPRGPQGAQANARSLKVELPKTLPSRLATMRKACAAARFAANPAGCPPESIVGHAVVHTPVLSVPLEGAVYFVAHSPYPSLIAVLAGDGVTIDLSGTTDVKSGITAVTFPSLPDIPLEAFELTLPAGGHSALAATGSLCAPTKTVIVKKKVKVKVHGHMKTVTRKVKQTEPAPLTMASELVSQSGKPPVRRSVAIAVSGCVRAKPAKRHKKARAKTRRRR